VLEARTRAGELDVRPASATRSTSRRFSRFGDLRTNSFEFVLGYPAEIVPVTNPYFVIVGDTLAVRCLVDGNRWPNSRHRRGARDSTPIPETRARTRADGVARFVIRTPGKWYIKFINMVPVSGDSVNYESKWATLTFRCGDSWTLRHTPSCRSGKASTSSSAPRRAALTGLNVRGGCPGQGILPPA